MNPNPTTVAVLSHVSNLFSTESKQTKLSVDKVLSKLQSPEFKDSLTKVIKSHMPKHRQAKNSDPDRPKRAKSAYIFFSDDLRASVKAQHAGISAVDVMKRLGEAWRALTPEQKEPFNRLHLQDKQRYDEVMKTYVRPAPVPTTDGRRKRGASPAEGSAPPAKRAPTGYLLYAADRRPALANQNLQSKEIMRRVAADWKALTDDQRNAWTARAREAAGAAAPPQAAAAAAAAHAAPTATAAATPAAPSRSRSKKEKEVVVEVTPPAAAAAAPAKKEKEHKSKSGGSHSRKRVVADAEDHQ